jgi:peptide/nickel transport system ATP-binding protein
MAPKSGDICIDGIAAADFGAMAKADRVRVRRTTQMVFQDPCSTLNPRHRVGQALEEALGASVGSGNPVTPERVAALLVDVGLSAAYATRRPSSLSGGERQRVAIARAVVGRPDVVLADEPTGNLDSAAGGQIIDLLAGLAADGTAVVVVTHDPAVAAAMDRRVVMRDGQIIADDGARARRREGEEGAVPR